MAIDFSELRRQSRIAAVLTAVASILVLGSLLVSYHETAQAKRELTSLQAQIGMAESDLLALQTKKRELKLQQRGLTSALNDIVATDGKAAGMLNQAAADNPAVAKAVPRIFLHSNRNPNKELLKAIEAKLRAQGFVVPAPDDDSNQGDPSFIQIVFFNNDVAAYSDVPLIKQALIESGLGDVSYHIQLYTSTNHPPRTYAVYLPRNVPT